MPNVEEEAIVDPDIFFTLPDTISLLKEQIEFGNIANISEKTGLDCDEIRHLLVTIKSSDRLKLRKVRIALGVQRARAAP
jgi:hypothetical protein